MIYQKDSWSGNHILIWNIKVFVLDETIPSLIIEPTLGALKDRILAKTVSLDQTTSPFPSPPPLIGAKEKEQLKLRYRQGLSGKPERETLSPLPLKVSPYFGAITLQLAASSTEKLFCRELFLNQSSLAIILENIKQILTT